MDVQRVAKKIATNVASHLDQAKIPNVLFGWLAVTLAGGCKPMTEVDFVIPDAYMPAAVIALTQAMYNSRSAGHGDRKYSETLVNNYHPVPAAHYHLESNKFVLFLHIQSSLLWWLPPDALTIEPPAPNDPLFMLSSDRRLQAYSQDPDAASWLTDYGLKVLTPSALTEAKLYLYCRDSARSHTLLITWDFMLIRLSDKGYCIRNTDCVDHPHGDCIPKRLRPRFQRAWDMLNGRIPRPWGQRSPYVGVHRLRNELAESGELGPLVDRKNYRKPETVAGPLEHL
ncbi:hypothetical protein BDW74DRAFT_180199 [Aspergillus multicolor]|uniref:uncharacterized protein n=1 Tax=Aspergillus multicolor TaxID=41759 RepID=UPI003CCE047C